MIRATDEDELDEVGEELPPEPAAVGARGIASTVLGATLCIGIVAGGAWWLIGLGEREAKSLPVFRAELHPAKIRPEDPGGIDTPYRDMRSYEVAAGDGAGKTEQTRLAPPPATPTEEDVAMAELSAGPERGGAVADVEPTPAEDADPAPVQTPPARPDDLVEQSASASQQAVDAAAQLAARAALSPVQIQLGAFTDRAYTEAQWHRIAASNADLLSDRALAIQSTTSGGKKFYRLRVGPFRDRAEATRICEALKARGQDCLVATNG